MLLLARFTGHGEDFSTAEEWFLPKGRLCLSSHVSERAKREARVSVSYLHFDDDLEDLLPYILEGHGPGSRLSVMKDPSTKDARRAKKQDGVFYTPADVAEYIVETVAGSLPDDARFLDPSCGTGVFLLALLRRSNGGLDYVTKHLHGIDASSLSIESCAFLLLNACRGSYDVSPWCAWHLIRLNLAAHDSLRLHDWPRAENIVSGNQAIRSRLLSGEQAKPVKIKSCEAMQPWTGPGHRSLWDLFPEAAGGFDSVLGNPPYAQLGRRDDSSSLEDYTTLPAYSATANTYPLFVEMMWRFVKRSKSCSGLVVPLSIAYHQGQQFTACRKAMSKAGGLWRCAFFDREPHALFGEDVKTRNAIIFHSDGGPPGTRLSVTPLQKFTSRTREKLFSSLAFTELGEVEFDDGMPKLGGKEEAKAFVKIAKRTARLDESCTRTWTCIPLDALKPSNKPRLFVASTAYNFLNIFRRFNRVKEGHPLSENKIHGFEFASEEDARIAFAILSSRLTFLALAHARRRISRRQSLSESNSIQPTILRLGRGASNERAWRGALADIARPSDRQLEPRSANGGLPSPCVRP